MVVPVPPTPLLDIRLAEGTAAEQRVRAWLEELLQQHDLSRWLFCRRVLIDGQRTVNQALLHDGQTEIVLWAGFRSPRGLLALFIHEQLHVHLYRHPAGVEAAVAELRHRYPQVPVGPPEGARSERSTYEHLLLCCLEQDALTALLGAPTVLRMKASGYRFIYREVESSAAFLRTLIEQHGLALPGAQP